MIFEDVLEEYMKYAETRHKKQVVYNLMKDFNNCISPFFNSKDVLKVNSLDVIEWENLILKRNYSNSYNKLLYSELCNFFDYVSLIAGIDCNVVRKTSNFPVKVEEKKDDFYTLEEFNRFICCVDDEIYKQYFNTLFFCGTRPSEAMALRFSDLNGNYLTVRHSLARHCYRELQTPKNQSSIRTIKIDDTLVKDFLRLKERYIKEYGDAREDYFIFGGRKPLAPTSIDRRKLKACQKANLRPITQHQFRHSHATFLLGKGIPLNEISRRLGHSQISTTLNIYCHVDLSQEKRVNQLINSVRTNVFYNLTKDFKNILVCLLKHI
ncbi:MAG: site-specific integrase [bacterium]|nr:site-specific integrase [bacterium]